MAARLFVWTPVITHSLTRKYTFGGKDEEARGRSANSCARARRHHRLRDEEDGENAGWGSERQGRDVVEVRRGNAGKDARQRGTHQRSRSEGAVSGTAR